MLEGAARKFAPDDFDVVRPDPGDGRGEPARPARPRAGRRGAREGAAAARVRPGQRRRRRPRRARPLLRRRRRLRARARPGRGGDARAGRASCAPTGACDAAGLRGGARRAGRGRRARRRRLHQRGLARRARERRAAVRQDPARGRARRVRRRGRRAALAGRAGRRARARPCARWPTTCWRSSGSTRGRWTRAGAEAFGRGLAALHAAGRGRVRLARADPLRPAGDLERAGSATGRRSTPSGGCARWPGRRSTRARCRAAGADAVERGVRADRRAGRPARAAGARCTATCGAAT